jgi:hypothetical protein
MARTPALAPFLFLATLGLPLAAQSKARYDWPARTYEESLARYTECLARKPFYHHWEAREVLAYTKQPEALQVLVKDYETCKQFTEYSRYLIAELLGDRFNKADNVAPMVALRNGKRGPVDTWLWYQTLRVQADHDGQNDVIAIATGDKSMLLRAAAIAALGEAGADLKQAIVANCVEFPKKESDRMALLGAMSGALLASKTRVNDEGYRAAITAYIGLLGADVKLSHTAKVQMARHLQIILKAPGAFMNPEAWLEILARGDVKGPARTTTSAAPRFFGIETDGERYCYVVDMSDSMLLPIETDKKGPITGPREKKKKGAILDENDIPWHLIKTRWDLARENLRISLSRLTPDKEFCVVWFGTGAGTLEACKGMIKASRGNIDKVMAELDGIKARTETNQPNEEMPPTGKLRGDTNLHGGLRLAFALHGKGFANEQAYVDPQALTEGCDTILLLSDGEPSCDDFTQEDKNYGEGKTVRSFERGEPAPSQPRTNYAGPFVFKGVPQCPAILNDVRRMNAFRRIRIHCVGLGEANLTLLQELAAIGTGESFSVGKKK